MTEGQSSILIVDDDEEDLALVERALRPIGNEIFSIRDPHEVLPTVHHRRPDVVILDALLPGLSGFDLCKQIKTDPQLKGTQVLILTGVYLRQQYRNEAVQQFKADAFLTKPFRPPELQRIVAQLLSRRTRTPQSSFLRRIGLPVMAEPRKPGLLGRLFGRGSSEAEPMPTRIAPVARQETEEREEQPEKVEKPEKPEKPEKREKKVLRRVQPVAKSSTSERAAPPIEGPPEETAEPSAEPEPVAVFVPDATAPADAARVEVVAAPLAPPPPANAEPVTAENDSAEASPASTAIEVQPGPSAAATVAACRETEREGAGSAEDPERPDAMRATLRDHVQGLEDVPPDGETREPPVSDKAAAARSESGAESKKESEIEIEIEGNEEERSAEPTAAEELDTPPLVDSETFSWIEAQARTQEMTVEEAASLAQSHHGVDDVDENEVDENDEAPEAVDPATPLVDVEPPELTPENRRFLEALTAEAEPGVASRSEPGHEPGVDAAGIASTRVAPSEAPALAATPTKRVRPRSTMSDVPVYEDEDFFTELKRELSKCKRVDRPLTLIVIQVGDLSQIVELFGRKYRQAVLWHVAEQAMASLREVDLVGMMSANDRIAMTAFASDRYGGGRIVSRMRKALEKNPFPVGGEIPPIIPVLIFGMATFPQDGDDVSCLMKKAEAELDARDREESKTGVHPD